MAYTYNRTVTVDHTKVITSNQTNFPVLFNSTVAELATVANGGHVTSDSGFDIIFSSSTDSADKLDHEILKYVPATGEFIAQFRQPTLHTGSDDVIHILYGDGSVTTSQENITGTWSTNYKAVWHLKEPSGTIMDSTSNDNDSTTNSGLTYHAAGKNGYSVSSSGSGVILLPNNNFPSGAAIVTLQIWEKMAWNTNGGYLMGYGPIAGGAAAILYAEWNVDFLKFTQVGGNFATSGTVWNNEWHKISLEINGSTAQQFYIDGSPDTSGALTCNFDLSRSAYLLDSPDAGAKLPANIQEARVYAGLLGANWEATEWNNQNSPSSFYQIGAEQGSGGGGSTPHFSKNIAIFS